MSDRMIDELRRAWVEALEEFIALNPVGDKSLLPNLAQVIQNVRTHSLLREGKNDTFVRRVYDDIRNIPEFFLIFSSMVTTFLTQIGDLGSAIGLIADRAEIYSEDSGIVDAHTLSRKAPTGTIKQILLSNHWLLMLLVASLHERDTIAVLVKHGLDKAVKK